jgi:hypothetical protein
MIGLWKDAQSGAATEIWLPEGSVRLVLHLSAKEVEEWTADGRSDGGVTTDLILEAVSAV